MINGNIFSINLLEVRTYVGEIRYLRNGIRHRDGGPAEIITRGYNTGKYWYHDGELHREGGPAIIRDDGYEAWFRYGQYHREDGPARVWPHGHCEWFLDGVQVASDFAPITMELTEESM